MRFNFLVILCVLYSFPASATTGKELLADCTADQETLVGLAEYLICGAYIEGVRDAHGWFWALDLSENMDENAIDYDAMTIRGICRPEDSTGAQAIDIVIAALKAHSELIHTEAAKFVYMALANAWPCDFETQNE